MSVLERAAADIAAGRLWKARDRLSGALAHRPHDQSIIDALADVYLRMGDVPAAGRFLMLSTRDDETARAARDEFRRPHRGNSAGLASALPVRPPLDAYEPAVRDRLQEIASGIAGGREPRWVVRHRHPAPEALRAWDWIVPAAFALLFLVPWAVGLVVAFKALVEQLA